MPVNTLEVKESPRKQGTGETIAYPLTTTPWGSNPSSVSVKIYENSTGVDRSATLMSGSASTTGDVITSPYVTGLSLGVKYKLVYTFTCSSNVFTAYCIIETE